MFDQPQDNAKIFSDYLKGKLGKKGALSMKEIQRYSDRALKFKDEEIFMQIEELKARRKNADREKYKKLRIIQKKIEEFSLEREESSYEENLLRFDALFIELTSFQMKNGHLSCYLKEKITKAFDELFDIHFLIAFPIVEEFNPSSYEENFWHKLEELRDAFYFDEKRAILLLMQLSKGQREAIFSSQDLLDKGEALRQFMSGVSSLLDVIKMMIYSDSIEGLLSMQHLPKKMLKEIESRLPEEVDGHEQEALILAGISYLESIIRGE